jgi:hypothetical protein
MTTLAPPPDERPVVVHATMPGRQTGRSQRW